MFRSKDNAQEGREKWDDTLSLQESRISIGFEMPFVHLIKVFEYAQTIQCASDISRSEML